jgi:protoporphyrinogen/coproporphyrinogen III oxidase
MQLETDVIIIGAGLTGLTTAHYLQKSGKKFIVLEQKKNVGGAIQTETEKGFTFEKGPTTGVLSNETVDELFDDLKGLCRLEQASNAVNKRYILKDGNWTPLPSGIISGIKTPLFNWGDKLRILGEPFRPKGENPNETLASFVKRRMGQSFLDYGIDPFILGVYAGDPNYIVPRFALPKLYNLEQNYGSLIGGSIKLAKEKRKTNSEKKKPKGNRIFSAEGGLSNLVEALYTSACKENFILGVSEITIEKAENGFIVRGIAENGNDLTIKTLKVISTVGAHQLPKLLPFIDKKQMSKISNLLYAKVVQVAVGFDNWKGMNLDAFGGLIPFKEKHDMLGVLFPSAFLSGRAPQEGALLSIFLGGTRRPEMIKKTDEEIKMILGKELCNVMNINVFSPSLIKIFRYQEAIPQYGADCQERFAILDELKQMYPDLIIGGNLSGGIGMADRIQQGKTLSELV